MRRLSGAVLSAALIGAALVPGVASAGMTKIDVCHSEGNGTFHLIDVAEVAYPTHVAHGDGAVGDPFPGSPGYVFGSACEPVLLVLVRVTSTDAAGVVHLVAQVEDTDGDGAYGAGDTLRTGEFPYFADDGTLAYAPATVTEFALDSSSVGVWPDSIGWDGHSLSAFLSISTGPGREEYTEFAVIGAGLLVYDMVFDVDGWSSSFLDSRSASKPSLPGGATQLDTSGEADLLTVDWIVLPPS